MLYRPIDEYSTRHLFSSNLGGTLLKLSYIGPVLDTNNRIQTSPDAMILDRRKSPYKTIRCEFKYIVTNAGNFKENGTFDIAVVWALDRSIDKALLETELFTKHGCKEIVVMEEIRAFFALPEYDYNASIKASWELDDIRDDILRMDPPKIVAAYIAAKCYPDFFNLDQVVRYLSKRYSTIRAMAPQGRANVVTSLLQLRRPLIERAHSSYYVWREDFDAKTSEQILAQWIQRNLREEIPSNQDIDDILNMKN